MAGPYDSLNVAATNTAPSIGTDADPLSGYENGASVPSGGYSVMAQIITGGVRRD